MNPLVRQMKPSGGQKYHKIAHFSRVSDPRRTPTHTYKNIECGPQRKRHHQHYLRIHLGANLVLFFNLLASPNLYKLCTCVSSIRRDPVDVLFDFFGAHSMRGSGVADSARASANTNRRTRANCMERIHQAIHITCNISFISQRAQCEQSCRS